jgi:predicted nucleic acid-binding protein
LVSFWDSSALFPLLHLEKISEQLFALQDRDPELVIWWGSRVECASAIARLYREQRLNDAEVIELRSLLDRTLTLAVEVAPSFALRDRAERLVAMHPLRAADAFQLAAALVWAREQPSRRGFVTLDQQLRRAALREGFDVLPRSAERV